MTVTIESILDRVQTTLQDTTGVRWPVSAELELWVNDAQREIALIKPDASAKNETVILVAGTKQEIPATGNRLLKIIRNMSAADGNGARTGGRSVRLVAREVLDSQTPDWHNPTVSGDAAHGDIIKHFVYDEANPRCYYVYPGVDATPNAFLEIVYSANPELVTSGKGLTAWAAATFTYDAASPIYKVHNNVKYILKATTASSGDEPGTTDGNAHWTKIAKTVLDIPDIYANAIMNYVLYMAYSKDADFAANAARSQSHYQQFATAVTSKNVIDTITSPNAMNTNPSLPPPQQMQSV
tara:strand:+ start:6231 stop:7121 length:891 start_codon:yes stop_codon:yes gene_type:complete